MIRFSALRHAASAAPLCALTPALYAVFTRARYGRWRCYALRCYALMRDILSYVRSGAYAADTTRRHVRLIL